MKWTVFVFSSWIWFCASVWGLSPEASWESQAHLFSIQFDGAQDLRRGLGLVVPGFTRGTLSTSSRFILRNSQVHGAGTVSPPPIPEEFPQTWRTENQIRVLGEKECPAPCSLRFAVMGDSRPERKWFLKPFYPPKRSGEIFHRILKQAQGLGLDFSMHVGDLVSNGKPEEYQAFLDVLEPKVSWPFLTVVGNHELLETQGGNLPVHYEEAFGPLNYFFDFRGFRFVVVNTADYDITGEELLWLEKVLDTPLRKVVFTHTPPMQVTAWTEFLWLNEGGFEEGSQGFTDLLAERRVERVYVGHLHGFGVAEYKGVRYVLSAGGGSPLYPWKPVKHRFYNFVLVEVDSRGRLQETVYLLYKDGRMVTRPISDFAAPLRF